MERPYGSDGETVDATPDPDGEVTTENIPDPGADDSERQTQISDWARWSP